MTNAQTFIEIGINLFLGKLYIWIHSDIFGLKQLGVMNGYSKNPYFGLLNSME